MTATNHVVAGAFIASIFPSALLAIPFAFISHFVMDTLPHYGDNNQHSWLNRHFKYVLIADILLSLIFLTGLVYFQPENWALLVICAVVAASPDLLWFPYFIAAQKGQERKPSKLARILKAIQWGERPWGLYIEGVFLIASFSIFMQTIR